MTSKTLPSPDHDPRPLAKRQQASRDEILHAAADAFTARGYAATSIDDIAERLGCTKGRVYHYFKTKGDLFLAVDRLAMDTVISSAAPIATGPGTATARLHAMAAAHARLLMNQYSFMRAAESHAEMTLVTEGRTREDALVAVLDRRDHFESLFEDVIAEGIANGEFLPADPSLLVKAVLGAVNWIGIWYRPEGGAHGVEEIAERFATFVTRGLGATSVAEPAVMTGSTAPRPR
jgi:AcrR family transcriptional regulator